MSSSHKKFFHRQENVLTNSGQEITVYKLDVVDEEVVLNEWAKHLREHYCLDSEIDFLRSGFGLSREEYLNQIKFPNPQLGIGAAVMSGDFSEILVHDYIEFFKEYYTTRTRYSRKINRNSSTMGSDVIGYKYINAECPSSEDELLVLEVKSQSSETRPKNKLQEAVDHSVKDHLRLAESLNGEVQRMVDKKDYGKARIIQRFQEKTEKPFTLKFSAVAVHSETSFNEELLKVVNISAHPESNLELLVIYSDNLMSFIKEMYVRASRC